MHGCFSLTFNAARLDIPSYTTTVRNYEDYYYYYYYTYIIIPAPACHLPSIIPPFCIPSASQ